MMATAQKIELPQGTPLEELEKADALMAALTNLAYSSEDKKKKPKPNPRPKGSRTSRFWFTLTSVEVDVEEQKLKMAPKALEHIDEEVSVRLKKYKKELSPDLRKNIEVVREFFLKELAPLTIATDGGVTQAKEVVQRLLDTEVDSALVDKFNNMANRAAVMRLALFVLDYFNLPREHLSALFPNGSGQDSELKQILNMLKSLPSKSDIERTNKTSAAMLEKTVEKVIDKLGNR
jgi:hypothetical protein